MLVDPYEITLFSSTEQKQLQKKMLCIMFVVLILCKGRRDRMVVGFTTTCAIRVYHY